jgi:hypothetical protein
MKPGTSAMAVTGPTDERPLRQQLRLSAALETLHEIEAYFDNRADIDGGIPNEAMRMLVLTRETIRLIEGK